MRKNIGNKKSMSVIIVLGNKESMRYVLNGLILFL